MDSDNDNEGFQLELEQSFDLVQLANSKGPTLDINSGDGTGPDSKQGQQINVLTPPISTYVQMKNCPTPPYINSTYSYQANQNHNKLNQAHGQSVYGIRQYRWRAWCCPEQNYLDEQFIEQKYKQVYQKFNENRSNYRYFRQYAKNQYKMFVDYDDIQDSDDDKELNDSDLGLGSGAHDRQHPIQGESDKKTINKKQQKPFFNQHQPLPVQQNYINSNEQPQPQSHKISESLLKSIPKNAPVANKQRYSHNAIHKNHSTHSHNTVNHQLHNSGNKQVNLRRSSNIQKSTMNYDKNAGDVGGTVPVEQSKRMVDLKVQLNCNIVPSIDYNTGIDTNQPRQQRVDLNSTSAQTRNQKQSNVQKNKIKNSQDPISSTNQIKSIGNNTNTRVNNNSTRAKPKTKKLDFNKIQKLMNSSIGQVKELVFRSNFEGGNLEKVYMRHKQKDRENERQKQKSKNSSKYSISESTKSPQRNQQTGNNPKLPTQLQPQPNSSVDTAGNSISNQNTGRNKSIGNANVSKILVIQHCLQSTNIVVGNNNPTGSSGAHGLSNHCTVTPSNPNNNSNSHNSNTHTLNQQHHSHSLSYSHPNTQANSHSHSNHSNSSLHPNTHSSPSPSFHPNQNSHHGNHKNQHKQISKQYFLVLSNDTNTIGFNQWFYFKVHNPNYDKEIKATFIIVNINKKTIQNIQQVGIHYFSTYNYKFDKIGWSRLFDGICTNNKNNIKKDQVNYYHTLQFQAKIKIRDTVYFALSTPYTYTKLSQFIKKHQPNFQIIGTTFCGNPIHAYKIGSANANKSILVTARQHPSETSSSFVVQGIINKLSKPSLLMNLLKKRFQIYVIPMVNPDGVIHGNSRTNLLGFDVNRKWQTLPNKRHSYQVFNLITGLLRKIPKVQYLIDLHGHSKKLNTFAYFSTKRTIATIISLEMAQKLPWFTISDCQMTTAAPLNTLRWYAATNLQVQKAITIETSIHGWRDSNRNINAYTPQGFQQIGSTLVDIISRLQLQKKSNMNLTLKSYKNINFAECHQSSDSDPEGDYMRQINQSTKNQLNKTNNNLEQTLKSSKQYPTTNKLRIKTCSTNFYKPTLNSTIRQRTKTQYSVQKPIIQVTTPKNGNQGQIQVVKQRQKERQRNKEKEKDKQKQSLTQSTKKGSRRKNLQDKFYRAKQRQDQKEKQKEKEKQKNKKSMKRFTYTYKDILTSQEHTIKDRCKQIQKQKLRQIIQVQKQKLIQNKAYVDKQQRNQILKQVQKQKQEVRLKQKQRQMEEQKQIKRQRQQQKRKYIEREKQSQESKLNQKSKLNEKQKQMEKTRQKQKQQQRVHFKFRQNQRQSRQSSHQRHQRQQKKYKQYHQYQEQSQIQLAHTKIKDNTLPQASSTVSNHSNHINPNFLNICITNISNTNPSVISSMIGSSLGGGIVSVNANINNGSTNASYNTNLSTLNTIGRILKRKVQEFQTDKLDTQLHGNTNSQMRDKYREKEREKQKQKQKQKEKQRQVQKQKQRQKVAKQFKQFKQLRESSDMQRQQSKQVKNEPQQSQSKTSSNTNNKSSFNVYSNMYTGTNFSVNSYQNKIGLKTAPQGFVKEQVSQVNPHGLSSLQPAEQQPNYVTKQTTQSIFKSISSQSSQQSHSQSPHQSHQSASQHPQQVVAQQRNQQESKTEQSVCQSIFISLTIPRGALQNACEQAGGGSVNGCDKKEGEMNKSSNNSNGRNRQKLLSIKSRFQ